MNYLDKLSVELFLNIILDKNLTIMDVLTICNSNKKYRNIYKLNKNYINKQILVNYNIVSENNLIYKIVDKDASFEKILSIYYKYLYNKKKLSIIDYDNSYCVNELPNLPKLEELNCCRFSLIKLQNFPSLIKLWCRYNNLSYIPFYPKLKELYCSYNILKSIYKYEDLEILECHDNQIECLSEYPKLKKLNCDNNNLKYLPIYPELRTLYCRNNKLEYLSSYIKLKNLYCKNNERLSYITNCPKLINIFCESRLYTKYKYQICNSYIYS
jgi:hypothetical protein